VWTVNEETDELLSFERDTLNAMSVAAWITVALAEWIGARPELRKPGKASGEATGKAFSPKKKAHVAKGKRPSSPRRRAERSS
jgi:hypothetical protein